MITKSITAMLAIVALVVSTAAATNPAFSVRVTDKFLQGLVKVMQDAAENDLKSLPDHLSSGHLPEGYKINKVHIREYANTDMKLKFAEPNQLQLTSSGGKVTVDADITIEQAGSPAATGTASITVGDINVELALAFEASAKNHLKITSQRCNVSIGQLDISTTGFPADNPINEFAGTAATQAKAMLPALICPQLQMALGLASARIDILKHEIPLVRGLVIDVEMTGPPKATADYLQFDVLGLIHKEGVEESTVVFNPAPIDYSGADNSRMMYLFIAEEHTNNFLREYHNNGLSKYTANKESDPEIYARAKKGVKELADKAGVTFNEENDVEVTVETAAPPTVQFKANPEKPNKGISLNLPMKLTVTLRPGREDTKTISAKITAQGDIEFGMNETQPEDAALPAYYQVLYVNSVELTDIQGADATPQQIQAIQELIKEKVQKYVSERFLQHREHRANLLNRIGKAGKITDMDVKFLDKTVSIGFNINIDVAKIKERIQNRIEGKTDM